MKTPLQFQLLLAFMFCLPFGAHATVFLQSAIQLRAEILSFLNVGLFITALISFKQFFWPGDNNTLPFQVFNMAYAVLFYGVGLPFLITNRAYYEGYENLLPIDVLGKFFLSINFSSIAQWFIIASVIINVLYIIRFRKDYYEAGIASSGNDDKLLVVNHEEATPTLSRLDETVSKSEDYRTGLPDADAEEQLTHLQHETDSDNLPDKEILEVTENLDRP